MSLRPRSGEQIPSLTAQVARASNPGGTTAMWVRDRLEGLWRDEDFAAWYPRDGRPGLSPAQLATVSVLQFLYNLSDRQAAEAVRCRLDFKYALALALDDPGFHHSVLSDFRERLAAEDRADALFDLALARLRQAGLVKARGQQRTDSTYILSRARELTRLELALEAVRAALEETARTAPDLLEDLVDEEWALRYGRQVRLVSQPSHPVTRLKQAGADGAALLERLRTRRPDRALGSRAEVLRQVLVQQFVVDTRGRLRPRTDKDGRPSIGQHLQSPYDTEARYVRRGHRSWTGYLSHVTETCDEKSVNVITDVATTAPTSDSTALPGIHTRLRRRRLLPAAHLLDGGYPSVVGLDEAARRHRVQLVGPVRPDNSWQRASETAFKREDFTIDFDQRTVTCPAGRISGNWHERSARAPYTVVRFNPAHCNPCPVRTSCTNGTNPRNVYFLPRHLHELQQQNRADQQDPRLATPICRPQWHRGHHRRDRQRAPDATLPLPQHRQGPHPARLHRHRDQHRTPGCPRGGRTHLPTTPAHGVPAVHRSPRTTAAPMVASGRMTMELQDPRQSHSLMQHAYEAVEAALLRAHMVPPQPGDLSDGWSVRVCQTSGPVP